MDNISKVLLILIVLSIFAIPVLAGKRQGMPVSCDGPSGRSFVWCRNAFRNEVNASSAYVNRLNYANKTSRWYDFDFGADIPANAVISNVRLVLHHWIMTSNGLAEINLITGLALNQGQDWEQVQASMCLGNSSHECGEINTYIDITNKFPWTPNIFNTGSIYINNTCVLQSGFNGSGYCYIDWMYINVTYFVL